MKANMKVLQGFVALIAVLLFSSFVVATTVSDSATVFTGYVNVSGQLRAGDWSNVTLTESQISDLVHTQQYVLNVSNSTSGAGISFGDGSVFRLVAVAGLNIALDAERGQVNFTATASAADGFWSVTGSKWVYNNSGVLEWNETRGNATFVNEGQHPNLDTDSTDDFDGAWSSLTGVPEGFSDDADNDTTYSENDDYLTLAATVFGFDEALLNTTIDARDSDTMYSESDKYITLAATVFGFNETALNATILALDSDTTYTAEGTYVFLTGTLIDFNETRLNATIDARDSDTTYSESDKYLTESGQVFGFDESALNTTIDARDTSLSGSAAGGDLGGTYPNPSVDDDSHTHGVENITGTTTDLSVDLLEESELDSLSELNTQLGSSIADGGHIGNCSVDDSCPGIVYNTEYVNLDTDSTDDFDGAYTSLTGRPAGLDDGDDDTTYTAEEFYIFKTGNRFDFNETRLNATIQALDTDTTIGNCTIDNSCSGIIYETEMDDLAEFDTQIGITGTASSSTYWRGDNSWATITANGDGTGGWTNTTLNTTTSLNVVVLGANFTIDSTQSETVFGLIGLSSGECTSFQFGGDQFNYINNCYGTNVTFRSHHGLILRSKNGEVARFGLSDTSIDTEFYGFGNFTGKVYSENDEVCTASNGLCTGAGGADGTGGWTNTTTTTTTLLSVNISGGNLTIDAFDGMIWGIKNIESGECVSFQYGGDTLNALDTCWGEPANQSGWHGINFLNSQGLVARIGTSSSSKDSKFEGLINATGKVYSENDETCTASNGICPDLNTQLSQEQVEDFAGGMDLGTETRLSFTYNDGTGNFDIVVDDMNDDTPDNDAEVPDTITVTGGNLGNNTMMGSGCSMISNSTGWYIVC